MIDGGAKSDEDVEQLIVAPLAASEIPTIVFAGHAHGYERFEVDGIHHVVTGGGGGSRLPLTADRPGDIYTGRDCTEDELGQVLRPFNYVLIEQVDQTLQVTVRGLCKHDASVDVLESFAIRLPNRN